MIDLLQSQLEKVNKAFSRQSIIYYSYEKENPTLIWMRQHVRKLAMQFLRPNDKILELNSGTGIDAEFFAKQGFSVHCTDLSDGMIEQMHKKFSNNPFAEKITIQQCSFTELKKIGDKKFDFIFSNFGGLNCVPDLRDVTRHFQSLLNENGRVCLVILPPVCPWEIIQILRGKFSFAFRRFKKNGTEANLEGVKFKTYYFSKRNVTTAIGDNFKIIKTSGLAVFSPAPQMERFSKKFPTMTKFLNKLDEKVSGIFPFNKIGDHIIIVAELKS